MRGEDAPGVDGGISPSLEAVLDAIEDVFYVVAPGERLVRWNDRLSAVTGYADEEIAGMRTPALLPPEERDRVPAHAAEVRETGAASFRGHLFTRDGERVPFEFRERRLTDEEGRPAGRCGVGRDVSGRRRRERALQCQRDELRRLDRINGLIRQVNRELVRADGRGAVERALADCLTADDGYAFAWVGEPDLVAGRLEPREAAGDGDGYLDDVTVTFEGDGADSGPAARAVTSRSIQVARGLASDDAVSWRAAAARRDLRSGAAVPVTHEGALYAVLNVYARRADAFEGRERTVLAELAGTVGHALNAVLCREVLTGEEAIELEFRLSGGPEPLVEATRETAGRISLERTVRAADGRRLWYVTVEGMSPDRVDAFEAFEPVRDVSVLASDDDRHRVEVLASRAPMRDALDPHGGRVSSLTVEDGELRLVAAVPPSADLRAVTRSVGDALPSASLVASRTTTSDPAPPSGVATAVSEALTDRQRSVLETAHAGGYFERPRSTTGEELADSLGIARSTFHQHLRAATRKLVELTVGGHT